MSLGTSSVVQKWFFSSGSTYFLVVLGLVFWFVLVCETDRGQLSQYKNIYEAEKNTWIGKMVGLSKYDTGFQLETKPYLSGVKALFSQCLRQSRGSISGNAF